MNFCLLCGARVEPNGRYPFTFAAIRVAYCDPCDQGYSDDKKLLAVARALDDRKLVATVAHT